MKNKVIVATAILVSLHIGTVSAADFSSPAYIDQLSDRGGPFPSVSTADIVKPVFQVASAISSLKPTQGNLGLVWQDGLNNNASVVQDGFGNIGLIRQIGLDNTASIEQYGSGHAAMVFQQGRGNFAVIRQR
jgi:minor curlin subunit